MANKEIKITQKRSLIGCTQKQKACIRGLGLRRIHHSVNVKDTPESRGMINVVKHMLIVEG
tara:strand:- start:93 stop:275 length:183 start_codon:yes stop_codon:yes gene_type:complete